MSDTRLKAVYYKQMPIPGFNKIAIWQEILQDQVTGVSYCLVENKKGITSFPLIDLDGKPWVDPTFKKE